MRTLLISPGGSDVYAKLKAQLPPLGLGYIAAVCREAGHEVKILDLGLKHHKLTTELIHWAEVVGISSDTPGYPIALNLGKRLKIAGKIVVLGGYHVSFLDEDALETGFADFVVRGEGEYVFLNLLNALENKTDFSEIAGISYKIKGHIFRNKSALPPHKLDKMPFPARDLMDMEAYDSKMNGLPFTNIITSRGCPFDCYFCSSSRFGGLKWRARSAKSIANEIEHLYKTYGYKAFSIMDDNFTLSPKRVFDFADELDKRGLNDIVWWCFSRVDILVKNEDMVKRMAEAGAYMVFLGLESTNEETLDTYKKNIGNNIQEKAIALLRKYSIKIHGSYIMGDVHETEEMVMQTINWARKVNAKTTQFSILTPYPGTALYEDIKKQNRFLHQDWKLYDALHPVIRLDHLTPEKTSKLLVKAYEKVYLNLRRWFMKSSKNPVVKSRMPEKNFFQKLYMIFKGIHLILVVRKMILKYKPEKKAIVKELLIKNGKVVNY